MVGSSAKGLTDVFYRVSLARRHLLAFILLGLVLAGALWSLPPIVDAVTGAAPGDAELARPFWYVVGAPLSNLLDMLTFLSLERAIAFLAVWILGLAAVGVFYPKPGGRRQRIVRALAGPAVVVVLVCATVLLPRPVDRHDVRVVDQRGQPRLALEALAEGGIGGAIGRDQLERDRPVEVELDRPVDDAHAAAPRDRLDAEVAEDVTGREGGHPLILARSNSGA